MTDHMSAQAAPPSGATSAPRRVSVPVRSMVSAAEDGTPIAVDSLAIDAVRESWLIEDRWWTDRPLRRRYWELVTTSGRNVVVFHDLVSGRWWRQR